MVDKVTACLSKMCGMLVAYDCKSSLDLRWQDCPVCGAVNSVYAGNETRPATAIGINAMNERLENESIVHSSS